MAEKKKTFPMLPGAHWWALREKFKQSIPGVVTANYLAAALDMKPTSARANVLAYLEDVGLIDKEGKTQELARAWRDDDQYPDVCRQIRERVYPEELLSAAPDPVHDRRAAERWFANNTGAGASAVRRMAQFYAILAEADASKKKTDAKPTGKSPKAKEAPPSKKAKETKASHSSPVQFSTPAASAPPAQSIPQAAPGVNINLEIHISADATPDQIDKIFESMAKHIYKTR